MPDSPISFRARFAQSWKSIAGALLLAILGSALWEYLARPGLSTIGRLALTVVTLGSDTIRDSAYRDAALDSFPLPSLTLIFLATTGILAWCTHIMGKIYRGPTRRQMPSERQIAEMSPKEREELRRSLEEEGARLDKRIGRLRRVIVALLTPVIIIPAVQGFRINQAVLIRRVMLADLTICEPFIEEGELKRLKSHFAQVRTRGEFLAVHSQLERVAKKNSVRLSGISLW